MGVNAKDPQRSAHVGGANQAAVLSCQREEGIQLMDAVKEAFGAEPPEGEKEKLRA